MPRRHAVSQNRARIGLARKYRSTFFIFPAFLPLVELLPWFLTLLGAAAGGSQLLSKALWQRKGLRMLLGLVSIGLFTAAGGLVWQRYGHQPAVEVGSELVQALPRLETHSAVLGRPLPTTVLTPLTELWAVKTVHQNLGKPLVREGRLFVGTLDGTFAAFATANGQPLWTLHKTEPVFTPPATAGDLIFIGEGYHTSPVCALTALAYPDGKPLWSRNFRSHLESYPALDLPNNRLWQSGGATGLWALAADTGAKLWWQPLGHMDVPPLYVDGRLFAIARLSETADGTALFELNPESGAIKWQTKLTGNTMGSIFRMGDRLVVTTAIGQVGEVKGSDAGWANAVTLEGKLLWSTKLSAMPLPEGALARDGKLFFTTLKDGSLVALRTMDGRVQWQEKIGPVIQTDVTLIEDAAAPLVVGVANDGIVSLRDAATGKERAKLQVEAGDSTPVYADGVLYITTPNTIRAYAGFGGR